MLKKISEAKARESFEATKVERGLMLTCEKFLSFSTFSVDAAQDSLQSCVPSPARVMILQWFSSLLLKVFVTEFF